MDRVRLKKGKQRELIEYAKCVTGTWKDLSVSLKCNDCYLKNELRNEKRTLSLILYKKLCDLASKSYNDMIEERLGENWGRKKGASMSPRTKAKNVKSIEPSEKLAEIVGIMLGDGNIYGKQYAVRICGHMEKDKCYLLNHVKPLFKEVFGTELKEYYHKSVNELILYAYSKFVVVNMEKYGLLEGNKKNNGSRIPYWILKNDSYTKCCIRGLFDTDGSVFINRNKIKIELSSAIEPLRNSIVNAMKLLGFEKGWTKSKGSVKTYGLYSKVDTEKFINIINFNNPKHKNKLCLDGVVA